MKGRSQGQERATWGPEELPAGETGNGYQPVEEMSGQGDGWRKEAD